MADRLVSDFVDLKVHDNEVCPPWHAPHAHKFQPAHYNVVTSCEHCASIIAALEWNQGMTCTECGFNSHKSCAPKVATNCKGKDPKSQHAADFPNGDNIVPHSFYEKFFDRPAFCNVCRRILIAVGKQGHACGVCGIYVHPGCMAKAAEDCVTTKFAKDTPAKFHHLWIEGNSDGSCVVCNANINVLTLLYGYHCFWCSRKVCSTCYAAQMSTDTCDMGKYKKIIVPPTAIVAANPKDASTWKLTIPPGTKPLIAFINRKSGGQLGEFIIRRFNSLLNPAQIIDLGNGGPKPILKALQAAGVSDFQIIACGGDGTVAWILQALDELKFNPYPPVAVIPLGTGNDLARTLGWGGGYDKENLAEILNQVVKSEVVTLDRWNLTVTSPTNPDPVRKFMNNYFSIGIDALIALDFHKKREENPAAFKNGTVNQMRYVALSMHKLVVPPSDLSKSLRVTVDGRPLNLPSIQGLLLINLPSYMKGTDAWGDVAQPPWQPQKYDDKVLEVVGINSALHLGQLQAGAASGVRLGQGSHIVIEYTNPAENLAMQLDGEPWEEIGAKVEIDLHNQMPMLKKRGSTVSRPMILARRVK